jgi:4-hydroxy-3-polyprenylbenzoate decarboxylase
MGYKDLRGWLEEVEKMGELKKVAGADWDREIGAISEMMTDHGSPALLFDNIKGYPEGFRVLADPFNTCRRMAPVFGVQENLAGVAMLDAWRKKLRGFKPVPPIEVTDGPVKENSMTGDDIDLYKFPAPIWHEKDVGRYLGTGCVVITSDLDTGWVNLGTYRCMIFDKNKISVGINPGKHGTIMMDRYHEVGKPCPFAIACGQDPMLLLTACTPTMDLGDSEYDFAGYIKGEPIEVVRGDATGLPIPATAEIVIEGEIPPPPKMEERQDGPFGEWRRIYNSNLHPLMEVKNICYRNNPIILGLPTFKLPTPFPFAVPHMAAEIWNMMENSGIPDVKGVWFSLGYVWASLMVISIKQRYPGHSMQAALSAISCRPSTIGGQYVVIVDDDIDITNEVDVLWAIINRATMNSFHVIEGLRTMAGAPTIRREDWEKGKMLGGRVIIDACWPHEHLNKKPVTARFGPEWQEKITKKFPSLFEPA